MPSATQTTPQISECPERGTGTMHQHLEPSGAHLACCRLCVLVLQLFTWNVACVSSLVVVTVFWGALVRSQKKVSYNSSVTASFHVERWCVVEILLDAGYV